MKEWLLRAAAASLLLGLVTGCGTASNKNNTNEMQSMQNRDRNQAHNLQQFQNRQNTVNQAEDRVEIAQAAAGRIDELPGVRSASVLVTRRNAYVAAVLDGSDVKLTRQMEDQIASEVRKVKPEIQNVYVSTNPDFVGRINGYMADLQQGRPIAGLADQLNEIAQRIFPDAR